MRFYFRKKKKNRLEHDISVYLKPMLSTIIWTVRIIHRIVSKFEKNEITNLYSLYEQCYLCLTDFVYYEMQLRRRGGAIGTANMWISISITSGTREKSPRKSVKMCYILAGVPYNNNNNKNNVRPSRGRDLILDRKKKKKKITGRPARYLRPENAGNAIANTTRVHYVCITYTSGRTACPRQVSRCGLVRTCVYTTGRETDWCNFGPRVFDERVTS